MRSNIWTGAVSFGLLNIPVTLQSASQDHNLHFSLLDKRDLSPIKYKRINARTKKEVPYSRIVKGYRYEGDQYIVMSTEDFKAANPKATQTIDLEDFVPLSEIDTMFFERPYYIVPQKSGAKGYALLREALARSKKIAIAKIVLRTKQHLAAIIPKEKYLILELLSFAHEVKEIDEAIFAAPAGKYQPRELKMAGDLIAQMSGHWKPEKYKDTYYKDLMKRIEAKAKKGQAHTVTKPDKGETEIGSAGSNNVLYLLKQSLAKKRTRKAPRHAAA